MGAAVDHRAGSVGQKIAVGSLITVLIGLGQSLRQSMVADMMGMVEIGIQVSMVKGESGVSSAQSPAWSPRSQ